MQISNKWYAIINPVSGDGHGRKAWAKISSLLDEQGIEYDYAFSERAQHIVDITKSAIELGYRQFIVAGGDGTIHETVNGIFNQSIVPTNEITIAVIPIGSGNDWVRMYGIPHNYSEAVDIITKKHYLYQDIGEATYNTTQGKRTEYFANAAGIGLDSEVIRHFTENNNKQSKVRYFWTLLKAVFGYNCVEMEISVDGNIVAKGSICSVAIGIGKYSGCGMMQVPLACVDDGMLDITVIGKISKLGIIRNVGKLYDGKIYNLKQVSNYKGRHIKVTAPAHIKIETDGELLGNSPCEFRLLDKALKVIACEKFIKTL